MHPLWSEACRSPREEVLCGGWVVARRWSSPEGLTSVPLVATGQGVVSRGRTKASLQSQLHPAQGPHATWL